ncbi:hypothetical protein NHX12_019535 [Muraenolepis orangiensis]|uniref:Bromodomain adjacent to zinc finger domain protein 1A n=1 Tax=Muraenolepis orangiensis TaxID=630683 RepID=A0A9Q0IWP0_9TELE|nr:hypothetical protein NHX12_019535 [Muraenolepis orangiensis]
MPLLHRKPFQRQAPPPGLRAEEEVFLCRITHEVFRTYDEFFERTILCNSLVWSCALTGKASLTYLEALESERRARQSLQSFSPALLLPLLHLVAASRRCRLTELCEDVFGFVKDRFFPGETVDVTERSGVRHVCEVVEVIPPNPNGKGAGPAALNSRSKPAGGDIIIISDSEDDPSGQMSCSLGQSKKSPLNPSVFRYALRKLKEPEAQLLVVKSSLISRKKNALSRERLKLLFKQHCEPQYGTIALKASTVVKYSLSDKTFSQFFPDEPNFPFSPPKGRGSLPATGSSGKGVPARESRTKDLYNRERSYLRATKRLEQECAPEEDAHPQAFSELVTYLVETTRSGMFIYAKTRKRKLVEMLSEHGICISYDRVLEISAQLGDATVSKYVEDGVLAEKRRLEQHKEEMMAAMQEQSRLKNEEQEQLEARRREKEEMRRRFEEEKQRRQDDKERMKLEKERDMECEDLKELPSPIPVHTRLPSELFGEALMVVEFLRVFGELFDLQDEFPEGVSLEVLEEALVGQDPEGPLCELLFFFLSAILQALNCLRLWTRMLTTPTPPSMLCTLSEVLRLHILASGADCNHGNAKFRYQKQGGFMSSDDPCVEFRLTNPTLVKKLSSTAVYDLTPGEKLCVLQTLEREEAAFRVRHVQDEDANSKKMKAERLELEQTLVRNLQDCIQKGAACTSIVPLGRDRLYRRYWLFPSSPALFVEEDGFGLTEDMLLPQPHHSYVSGPPVKRPNQWSFYSSVEEVELLLEALNPRGHRESGLREALLQEKERLPLLLDHSAASRFTCKGESEPLPPAESYLETRLRDLLLDIEDRIYQGTLGYIKVMERGAWRSLMEGRRYHLLSSDGKEAGGMELMETQPTRTKDRLQGLRTEGGGSSGSGTPQAVSSTVRSLALALAQVEQGIERKFLKAPLGEEEKKDLKLIKKSKKKDEEQASDDGSEGRVVKTVLERWRESLMASSSLSQVFVHLSTLERSVLWSRSLLNTCCKICRRKGDSDTMLLCDGCDRGHHTQCLRPRLKSIPAGDWFCPACRPKQRSSKIKLPPRSKPAVATPPSDPATPRASSAPSGKSSAANRSAGKKTPPSTSRGGVKTQNGVTPSQGHARKRPLAEVSPSPKPSLPILTVLTPSSSSSSRRSSGRNHGVHQLSACERLTVELVRHQDSWPFIKLVSRTQIPDYYEVIQRPIALSIIREKVNNCEYKTPAQYIEDVDLMFSNCLQYNPRHTNEAKAGVRLQNFFCSELAKLGLSQPRDPPPKRTKI